MMRSIFYGFIISILVAVVSSFPTGSGTCSSTQATIENVANSPMGKLNNALTYSFSLNLKNNNYIPGASAVLTMNGNQSYNGILLYALDSAKNHVGSWTNFTNEFKILNLSCPGDPEGTLTHNSATPKPPTTQFTWKAPAKDAGPVMFVGTVVVNAKTGFQIVKSPSFSVAGSNFTPPASTNTAMNPQPAPSGAGGSTAPTPSSNSSVPSSASSLMGGSLLLAKLGLVATLVISYL